MGIEKYRQAIKFQSLQKCFVYIVTQRLSYAGITFSIIGNTTVNR